MLNLIDLSQLKLEDASFVDEDLYQHESDILFSVKRAGVNANCFLYTLCEHQSTPDPEMPFSLIYYLMQFLKRYLIDHRPSPFPLPLIYPLVVYNGNVPWKTHRNFFDFFAEPLEFMRAVFLEPFPILDITQMKEVDLRKAHLCNLMLASLLGTKNIQDMERKVKLLDTLLQSCGIDTRSGILRSMLKYFISSIDSNSESKKAYLLIIEQCFSVKYQGVAMNLLELVKQEGIEQGMKKGAEEAIKKTALQMLREGVDKAFIAKITNLAPKEVRKLSILAAQEVN